jgi:DNA-binding NarL/FixJ family response regulator
MQQRPLTSQESRVALLVARGLTNKEVAAALVLSPTTVEHHLGNVYRKRGPAPTEDSAAATARCQGSPVTPAILSRPTSL